MSQQQWLVSINKERTFGPFKKEQMFEFIDHMILLGDESVAEYPNGSWKGISQFPDFYDRMLEKINIETSAPSLEARITALSQTVSSRQKVSVENQNTSYSEAEERAKGTSKTGKSRSSVTVESVGGEEAKESPREAQQKTSQKSEPVKYNANPNYTNQSSSKNSLKKEKASNPLQFLFFGVIVFLLVYLLLPMDSVKQTNKGKIHLLAPKWPRAEAQLTNQPQRLSAIAKMFERDTFSNYLKSQNELIGLIEKESKPEPALAMLCLVYRELWPYTVQDTTDLSVLSQVAQKISQLDPVGVSGATCRVVQQLLTGKMDAAGSVIDGTLSANAAAVVFYEMKAQILAQQSKDYLTAVSYVQKSQQLWNAWLKPYVFDAQMRMLLGQPADAANILQSVIKSNPKHSIAKIELGYVELMSFGHVDQAKEYVNSAMNDEERLTSYHEARARFILATVYERQGALSQAKEQAEKAYAMNSQDEEIQKILARVGGAEKLSGSRGDAQAMIINGDNFVKAGNCFAAQAEYKAAFEMGKSAVAAMKAGQCLWQLHQGTEAITWMKKATATDAKLVTAHALLAQYYAERFDFQNALVTLNTIAAKVKNNYEILRAFAQVELIRQNYLGAFNFAQQALRFYNTDLDTHLIMVKAHMGQQNFREAFNYAARAIELEPNNVAAQALYAEVLAGLQGSKSAIAYLQDKINTYPAISAYRLALAKVLKKEEKFPEAIQAFMQVTEIDSENKEAFILLGETYLLINKNADAKKAFLMAATIDPSDVVPLDLIARVYLRENNSQQAIQQFERVIALNENYPRAYLNIGRAALMMGDTQKALQMAQKEQRLNPNLADPYILSAEAYIEMRQFSKSIGEYQKAIKLRPQGAELYVKLARAYRLSGNLEIATSMLNIAATKESGYAEIYKETGAVFEQKGSNSEAAEAYNQYLKLVPNAQDRDKIQTRINKLLSGG